MDGHENTTRDRQIVRGVSFNRFFLEYILEISHCNPESIDTNKTVIFPFVCMKLRPSFSLYYIVVGIGLEQREVSPSLANFDLGP